MAIIDEKGKIFGKINVIDFLVILFLLCILPAFYFGYKILANRPVEVPVKREFIEIETDCRFIKLEPEILKSISEGDKELNKNGKVIGEIITLGQYAPHKYMLDIGKGQKIIKEDKELKQIEAKLRLQVEVKEDRLFYKNKLVKLGLPFKFKVNKYNLNAIFVREKRGEKEEEKETVTLKLNVKFKNLMPELSGLIKAGDKQIEIVEPNIKKIVARAVRVISNEPAEYISLVPTERAWSIIGHPKNRDLILEIETLCMRKPEGLFLGNRSLKIGKPFEFSTDLYTIAGTIIRIEQK